MADMFRRVVLAGMAAAFGGTAMAMPAHAGEFGNKTIALAWTDDAHLSGMHVIDRLNNRTIPLASPFVLKLREGIVLRLADLTLQGAPKAKVISADPKASRLADRSPGTELDTTFVDAAGRFRIDWRLTQRDGAHYLRSEITVTALKQDEAVTRIDLFAGADRGAEVIGRVAGSPIVVGQTYFQFENPLSKSLVGFHRAEIQLWVERTLPVERGKSVTYSAVVGTSMPGQTRRDFLAYLEAERAHPYRPFLHYNSWYDIGYFTPYTEAEAIDRIDTYCRELTQKRGARLDSFLFDDGWDDRSESWNFSRDFPQGFKPVAAAAAKCGAAPGIWLSPWGGYGKPKEERVAAGSAAGYETIDGGFALSGPRYYQRFHDTTVGMLTRDGINQFKFDGTGNANSVVPGSTFDSDFDAAISLIGDLRAVSPDLFVNLTTGTYPSPAWLRFADTIWRDGEDHGFAGVGSLRERWITYRDQQTYENIVTGGPLFPLNSLMLHGIIYATHAPGLADDPGNDFANEVHSYFGTGTELQELYVTPSLLTPQNWDMLAAAARWSRDNAATLKDTHWIGGNPARLAVYGWAAWSPKKAIVTLRNPDAKPQAFLLDLPRALELPGDAAAHYTTKIVWSSGAAVPATLDADKPTTIALAPFEVLTIELSPRR